MVLILFQIFKIILNIIKKHKTWTAVPPIHVYINRINYRLVFKIKLELQAPKTMRLFGNTKKLTDKTKKGEKVPRLDIVEVVLVQGNLVDNLFQQNCEVLHTFPPNK